MTTSPASPAGSAARWGPRWGWRAADWDISESQQVPTYAAALDRVGLASGQRMLDIGCGAGTALRVAADRGARVAGLDASEGLLDIARARVPEADLRVGDMEALPFEDDAFDVVTGFNSFFFASDIVAALREARRVARPGGSVVIQVWGAPERCDLDAMKHALAPFLPPRDPAAPPPVQLWRPGVLEGLAEDAGLRPAEAFDVRWAYAYPDEATLTRAMLSPGLFRDAVERAEEPMRAAVVEALAPYRTGTGGYRLENEWHVLVTRA